MGFGDVLRMIINQGLKLAVLSVVIWLAGALALMGNMFLSSIFLSTGSGTGKWRVGTYTTAVKIDHREDFYFPWDERSVNSSMISPIRLAVISFPSKDERNVRRRTVSSLPYFMAHSRALSPL